MQPLITTTHNTGLHTPIRLDAVQRNFGFYPNTLVESKGNVATVIYINSVGDKEREADSNTAIRVTAIPPLTSGTAPR